MDNSKRMKFWRAWNSAPIVMQKWYTVLQCQKRWEKRFRRVAIATLLWEHAISPCNFFVRSNLKTLSVQFCTPISGCQTKHSKLYLRPNRVRYPLARLDIDLLLEWVVYVERHGLPAWKNKILEDFQIDKDSFLTPS